MSAAAPSRFVGRGEQLDALRAAFEDALLADGSIVLIAGESGLGKSRLAAEFVGYARARKARAGIGRCLEYAPAPFAPLLEALGDAGVAADGDEADFASAGKRGSFEILARTLRTAAGEAPLLLVVDDLQWADESTRDFLRFAREHVGSQRLVLCVTYRSDEVTSGPIREAVAMLQSGRAARTILLEPLSDFEMKALMRNLVEGRRQVLAPSLDGVHTLAEGNPFVAEELIKSLIASGGGGTVDVPAGVREAVLRRFDSMGPGDRDVLIRAAVMGRNFTSDLLARVAGAPHEEVLGAIRRAIGVDLLAERGDGEYGFRHARTQRIITDTILVEEVRAFHGRVARELEARPEAPGRAAALAHHWWEAGDVARAASYAESAGDAAAAAGLFEDAATNYERALAAEQREPGTAAMLAFKLGAALLRAGRAEEAWPHAERAVSGSADAGAAEIDATAAANATLLCAAAADDVGDAAGAQAYAIRAEALATQHQLEAIGRRARWRLALASDGGRDPASALAAASAEAALVNDAEAIREIETRLALSRMRLALRHDALREARAHFEDAFASAGDDARLRRRTRAGAAELGAALEASGATDAALAVYERADLDDALRITAAASARNRQGRAREELTRREREVAERVAEGKSNRTIAGELFVSERTVEDHIGTMLRKLALKNRAELAARIARGQSSAARAT